MNKGDLEFEIRELKNELKNLQTIYGELLEKCQSNDEVCQQYVFSKLMVACRIYQFVDAKMLADPLVCNSIYPTGMPKKELDNYSTKASDAIQNKGKDWF